MKVCLDVLLHVEKCVGTKCVCGTIELSLKTCLDRTKHRKICPVERDKRHFVQNILVAGPVYKKNHEYGVDIVVKGIHRLI